MKKFLTVLLVIAVMFTFSFGSAFAAVGVETPTATTHDEAMAEAVAEVTKEIDTLAAAAKAKLATTYKLTEIYNNKYIPVEVEGSVYAATIDQMAEDYKAVLAVAAQKVSKANPTATTGLVAAIKDEPVSAAVLYAGANEVTVKAGWFTAYTADGLVNYVTAATAGDVVQGYYMVYTYTNALAGMKADLTAELAKVDMDAYTDDVIQPEDAYKTTYAQKAEKAMAALEEMRKAQ